MRCSAGRDKLRIYLKIKASARSKMVHRPKALRLDRQTLCFDDSSLPVHALGGIGRVFNW